MDNPLLISSETVYNKKLQTLERLEFCLMIQLVNQIIFIMMYFKRLALKIVFVKIRIKLKNYHRKSPH